MPAENLAARHIDRESSGLVVDPRDAPAFFDAAQRLLDDPAAREQMGGRARAYAERTFAIGSIPERFEAVMRDAKNLASV